MDAQQTYQELAFVPSGDSITVRIPGSSHAVDGPQPLSVTRDSTPDVDMEESSHVRQIPRWEMSVERYLERLKGSGNLFRMRKSDEGALGPTQWSDAYLEVDTGIFDVRARLPCFQRIGEVLDAIATCQALYVEAATGSGKTTQIPVAMSHLMDENGVTLQVWEVQPRQIAVQGSAERHAVEMELDLGQELGVQMRKRSNMPRDNTEARIISMTDGMLQVRILQDPDIKDCGVLILDECHERGVNMELCLGMIWPIMKRRPDLRLILMSATGEKTMFMEHMQAFDIKSLAIEGRSKQIEFYFSKAPVEHWQFGVRDTILDIVQRWPIGDILVFCPGEPEIKIVQHLLEHEVDYLEMKHIKILPLYRSLDVEKQTEVTKVHFEPKLHDNGEPVATTTPEGKSVFDVDGSLVYEQVRCRSIVLSTTMAETSVTLPGLDFVIDAGYSKIPLYEATCGTNRLLELHNSRAQCLQRAGRVGRVRNGHYFFLGTEDLFNSLPEHHIAPILRADIAPLLLKIAATSSLEEFRWLQIPLPEQLVRANSELVSCGILDPRTKLITELGKQAAHFPILAPPIAAMLAAAKDSPVADHLISLAAVLTVEGIYDQQEETGNEPKLNRAPLQHPSGDHLTLLNMFNFWRCHKESRSDIIVAVRRFLRGGSLLEAQSIRNDLLVTWTGKLGRPLPPPLEPEIHAQYSRLLLGALLRVYSHNMAFKTIEKAGKTQDGKRKLRVVYRNWAENEKPLAGLELELPPPGRRILHRDFKPNYVLYSKLRVRPGGEEKLEMELVSALEPQVMYDFDPEYFRTKLAHLNLLTLHIE